MSSRLFITPRLGHGYLSCQVLTWLSPFAKRIVTEVISHSGNNCSTFVNPTLDGMTAPSTRSDSTPCSCQLKDYKLLLCSFPLQNKTTNPQIGTDKYRCRAPRDTPAPYPHMHARAHAHTHTHTDTQTHTCPSIRIRGFSEHAIVQ
jgi:hypothetical protein